MFNKDNTVAKILMIIGILEIVAGFFVGIYLGEQTAEYYGEFNITAALIWWVAGLFSGMVFIGFAEIIELLDRIHRKQDDVKYVLQGTNTVYNTNSQVERDVNNRTDYDENSVPENYQNRIRDFYSQLGLKPVRFIKTPFYNLIYVEMENSNYRLVENDLFSVREIEKENWTAEFNEWVTKQEF